MGYMNYNGKNTLHVPEVFVKTTESEGVIILTALDFGGCFIHLFYPSDPTGILIFRYTVSRRDPRMLLQFEIYKICFRTGSEIQRSFRLMFLFP